MTNYKDELVEMMRAYMYKEQISQNELARRLGVSGPTLSEWMHADRYGIARKNEEKIREVCGHSVLIHGDGNAVATGNNASAVAAPKASTPVDVDAAAAAAVESFRRNAMDAVMESPTLPGESKLEVYSILKDTQP